MPLLFCIERPMAAEKNSVDEILGKTINICLIFLLAALPIIVNPTAIDFWYRPKAHSMYVLLIILWVTVWLRHKLCNRPFPCLKTPLTGPLIAYAISAVISTIFSVAPDRSLRGDIWREESLFTILGYVALTLAYGSLITSGQQAMDLLKGLIVTSFLISLYGCLQYIGINPTEHFIARYRGTYINSTLGNANFLGKFIVLTLPLSIGWLLLSPNSIRKFILFGVICIQAVALVLTFTRASWLACICALSVFILCLRASNMKTYLHTLVKGIALAVIGSACLLIGIYSLDFKERRFIDDIKPKLSGTFDFEHGMGSGTRLFVWRKTLDLILQRPLFGYGPDAHEKAMKVFNEEYIKKFNNPVILDRAHNNYLDIALAQGIVGLGAYLWVIGAFVIWIRKTIMQACHREKKLIYISIFSAVSGCLINDFFIFSIVTVSPTFWSLLGLSLALKRYDNHCSSAPAYAYSDKI